MPVNIRELFNELRRYFATGELENAAYVSSHSEPFRSNFFDDLSNNLSLNDAVSCFENYYINKILSLHDGKKNKTATSLGIDPRTLYNKLNRTKTTQIKRKKLKN